MNVTRVFDLLEYYTSNFGEKPDMYAGKVNGEWVKWPVGKTITAMHDLAYGLINAGIEKGDRIGLIAPNKPEWNIIDFAIQLCGAVSVPVYPNISESDLAFIIKDSGAVAFFGDNAEMVQKLRLANKEGNASLKIFSIDNIHGVESMYDLIESGKAKPRKDDVDQVKSSTKEDDLLTLLYTSGTTGTPKGVMLMHSNLVSNFTSLCDLPPVDHTCRVLSFLPLNHIYERMLSYLYLYRGPAIYYAESLEKVGDNIREVKPHMFSCVPRLVEKVYERIVSKGEELTGIKRKLFFWAIELGEQYDIRSSHRSFWYNFRLSIVSKVIFSKWREALGGNVRAMVSGGAALSPRLARIFWAAGIPVLEGYGLTETSPVIAVNNFEPNSVRFGTVGPVIKNSQVKIAEDGEILLKGPGVMRGYWKRQDATDEVIDSDGWFHTGDIGEFVENRFLKITDRKKEIFKTSGGKYIAPQMIENLLNSSRFIEQSMVIGESRKFPAALVVPSFAFIREWARRKGYTLPESNDAVVNEEKVMQRIMEEVENINKGLAQYERIKQIILVPKAWSVEGGEMTPKLSLKRKVIMKEWDARIDRMYLEADKG